MRSAADATLEEMKKYLGQYGSEYEWRDDPMNDSLLRTLVGFAGDHFTRWLNREPALFDEPKSNLGAFQ